MDTSILGKKVRDTITGFKGVATGIAVYLHSCPKVMITASELNNGNTIEQWFDLPRVSLEEKPVAGFN